MINQHGGRSMEAVTEPEKIPVPALAAGMRQLILRGEHFRHVLARQLRLGSSDLSALGHLNEGPLTPRELATCMDITSGSTTALLDRLEQHALLSRANNPSDRRSLIISITPTGQDAVRWLYEQFDTAMQSALAAIGDLSQDRLAEVLTVLADAMDARAEVQAPRSVPARV
jgi:DNA-binding MarR family transcriptional regulator